MNNVMKVALAAQNNLLKSTFILSIKLLYTALYLFYNYYINIITQTIDQCYDVIIMNLILVDQN